MTPVEVKVALSEIIERDHEGFLDLLSELATGTPLLMDVHYAVVGLAEEHNTLLINVWGDDSEVKKGEENERGS